MAKLKKTTLSTGSPNSASTMGHRVAAKHAGIGSKDSGDSKIRTGTDTAAATDIGG